MARMYVQCGFESVTRSITHLVKPETEKEAAMAVFTPAAVIGHSHDDAHEHEGQSQHHLTMSCLRVTYTRRSCETRLNGHRFFFKFKHRK